MRVSRHIMRPSTRRWETRRHSLEEESDLCAIVPALAVRRFTAYGFRMVKSGPFRYDENQCGEPRRRLRRITALRNGSEPFPCPGEVEKRLDILLLEHGVSASIARFDS